MVAVLLAVAVSNCALATPSPRKKPVGTLADLRVGFDGLLGQYSLLAWGAILSTPDHRRAAFNDAVSALNQNARGLASFVGRIYGDTSATAWLTLWKHGDDNVLAYAQAVATHNKAQEVQASNYLIDTYPGLFGAEVAGLTHGGVPADEASARVREAMVAIKAVADQQALRNFNAEGHAFDELRRAMGVLARRMSEAVQKQFPSRWVGSSDLATLNLRVRLDSLLQQQMFTLAVATRANLASNIDLYYALFARSELLTDAMSGELSAYGGSDFGSSFVTAWKKYTSSLHEFEKACESHDTTLQKRILGDLSRYGKSICEVFVPPTVNRLVIPPRKGHKRPPAPKPSPFLKVVQNFILANVQVIRVESHRDSSFGVMRRVWHDTDTLALNISSLVVGRFGHHPQPVPPQASGN